MRRLLTLVGLLTILIATRSSAQIVRGVLHDSASGSPLAGAVVTALDSAGRSGERTITDAAGRFAIATRPASARLRIVRIGFRPQDVPLSTDRRAELDVRMSHIPPILEVTRVSGTELCPGSSERGAAFQIWEQARAGLLATVVARDLNPATATTVTYATHLSPSDKLVREQTKDIMSGQTTRPFVASERPSYFASAGYMQQTGTTRVFSAPDADVLVDDSFAETHCFRLRRADDAHPGQVGIAFAPASGRDTLVDVNGVIWVDAATPQLRSLDFTYTSLEPAAMSAEAGGHIEFRTMPNGISFLEHWNLRLVGLEQSPNAPRTRPAIAQPRRWQLTEFRVKELVDAGGVVLDASWPDGARYTAPRSFVKGVVVAKATNTPIAGAIVTLVGTPDTVRTDSVGHFSIETLPGKYLIMARDTTLTSLIEPRLQSTPVEIHEGAETSVRLEVAPLERVLADVCHGEAMPKGSALVIGFLSANGGTLPRDVFVEATFKRFEDTRITEVRQKLKKDDDGRFVVCGTPKGQAVRLTVRNGSGPMADTTVVVDPQESAHELLWAIRRP